MTQSGPPPVSSRDDTYANQSPGYPYSGGAPEPPPGLPARPSSVTAVTIVLIVLGVLTAILGLFVLLAASIVTSGMAIPGLEEFQGSTGAIGGILVVIGGVVIAFGVLEVVSGINLLSARSWARILGIVLAVVAGLFALLGAIPNQNAANGSPLVSIVLLAAYAYVIWILATSGRYFTR